PLLALSLWRAGDKPMFVAADPALEQVAREVAAYLHTSNTPQPTLRVISGGKSWVKMVGLALALHKQHVAFAVADHWLFLVGSQFAVRGSPHFDLGLADRRLSKAARDSGKYELISSAGDLFVYLHRP
ncbi:MAG TPA: hypothetical protein VF294_16845, partial [Polyangiaceae bacterium]